MNREPARIQRSIEQRVEDCASHVRFLEGALRAFADGDHARYKQIAVELRVLVCSGRQNKPLLLDLMDQFGLTFPVRHGDGCPMMTLREYVSTTYIAGAEERAFTVHELIWSVASQMAAHEDRAIDSALAKLERSHGSSGAGMHAQAMTGIALMVIQANKRLQESARSKLGQALGPARTKTGQNEVEADPPSEPSVD